MSYYDEDQPIKFDKLKMYVDKRCKDYGIDSSHDTSHAIRVMELAVNFAQNDLLPNDEIYVCILASMLHDTIDKKYMNEDEAAIDVENWLRDNGIKNELRIATMKIITNMSYSTCLKKKLKGKNPYPDDLGRFTTAYHIVRHADLIDAYDPQRCYDYVLSKLSDKYVTDDEQKKQVLVTFTKRILLYISDNWIFRPDSLLIAQKRHDEAVIWLKDNGFYYLGE
jgi:HD superfamily phosphodiesterase